MLRILNVRSKEADEYAVKLGIAMQLTNILRDIGEDWGRGRIYLPLDEMRRFSVTEEMLSSRRADEPFIRLMKFQIERARGLYVESKPGLSFITDKRCRFVAVVMKELYAGILDAIEHARYDVFRRRAAVPIVKKTIVTLNLLCGKKSHEN